MACGGADPVQSLCEETTCPICLDYFQEPVLTPCGHVFCRACIALHRRQSEGGSAPCPQCREDCPPDAILRPVRPLASIAEIARRLSPFQAAGKLCTDHQEPLKLFCQQDRALLCVVCDRSKGHRRHHVVPKKEAFEKYKERIRGHLSSLKQERQDIMSCNLKNKNESQNLLEEAEAKRKKIVAKFKHLRQFLEEKEQLLLTKLKNLDDGIQDESNKIVDRLAMKLSSVDKLIKEIEEKYKQPEDEFLQDIKSTLKRCDRGKFVEPKTSFSQLRAEIQCFSETHSFLELVMKKFKDTVRSGLNGKKDLPFPRLLVSTYRNPKDDGSGELQAPYCWSSVMGLERINSGRHSWVVDVGKRKYWLVGVVKEDFRELNQINLSTEGGVWAVGRLSLNGEIVYANDDVHGAITPGVTQEEDHWVPTEFKVNSPSVLPQKIRVSLDYEEGSVTFSDADKHCVMYTYRDASFAGSGLRPWFSEGTIVNV